jgi:hypothetical protein
MVALHRRAADMTEEVLAIQPGPGAWTRTVTGRSGHHPIPPKFKSLLSPCVPQPPRENVRHFLIRESIAECLSCLEPVS